MDKKTPKRKSLANTNTTPTKIQKVQDTPTSQKKNKTPKSAKKQKKQLNGNQNTPKEKKKSKQVEEDETELMMKSEENDSDNSIKEENDTDNSMEQENEENGNSDAEDSKEGGNKAKIPGKDRKHSVYFAGLSYSATDSDVKEVFDDTNILSVYIIKKGTKLTGSGFINFKDQASVQKALLKDGEVVDGRKLTVKKPETNKTEPAVVYRKRKTLESLKLKVQQLEKELAGKVKKNLQKPTHKKNKNIKTNKKNKGIKKEVKQE